MREYANKPESQSRTLDSNPRASRQAPIADILQAYKNGALGRQPVQRESVEDEELLQAKTSEQAPVSAILQRYKESIQRFTPEEEDELLQGKFDTTQRETMDDDELLQGKFESDTTFAQKTVQREEKPNNTGLPDNLKTGIENLSGYSMEDVKVHYNSDKPAQLNALAYAQGTDIHVAPREEKYLPHEAWHVVQQKQGRVQPTMQLQGVNVNDNKGLEKEADVMGRKAMHTKTFFANHEFSPILQTNKMLFQFKWIDDSTTEYYQWQPLINGILWLSHKEKDLTYYMIVDKLAFELAYGKANLTKWAQEQGVAKPYADWLYLEEGYYEDEDVIEKIPRDSIYDIKSKLSTSYPNLSGNEDFTYVHENLSNSLTNRIIDICIKHNVPTEENEKSFHIENLFKGIRIGLDQQPDYFHYVLGALINDSSMFRSTFDAIVYTTYKKRWDISYFKPIVLGMVFDEVLEIPRGFDAKQFQEFKKDYVSLLSKYGNDIRIQGSTTIKIPGSVKDIDIAIIVTIGEFNQRIISIHKKNIIKALVDGKKREKTSTDELNEDDILTSINLINKVMKIEGEDKFIDVNSRQRSLAYIYPRGFIKHSDFMDNTDKSKRDNFDKKWMTKLKLEECMDISIILNNSPFDKKPYIKLN